MFEFDSLEFLRYSYDLSRADVSKGLPSSNGKSIRLKLIGHLKAASSTLAVGYSNMHFFFIQRTFELI